MLARFCQRSLNATFVGSRNTGLHHVDELAVVRVVAMLVLLADFVGNGRSPQTTIVHDLFQRSVEQAEDDVVQNLLVAPWLRDRAPSTASRHSQQSHAAAGQNGLL